MKRIVLSLVALAAVLSVPLSVLGAGVSVTPAVIERRVDPGQTIELSVTITNEDEAAAVFYPSVRDVIGMDENSAPQFAPADYVKTGGELSSYVAFKQSSIRLEGGEKTDITAVITLPQNAPQGGTFGLIGVTQTPPTGTGDGTSVAIGFQTGALVSLRVGADATDDAKVLEFKADSWLKTSSDTTFSTRIENIGTAMVRPYGVIEVRDLFGRMIATTSFNETKRGIMPGSIAKYDSAWQPGKQLIGRYEATLAATYGDQVKKSLVTTTAFWVFPGKMTAIVLCSIVVLFTIVYFWARSYIKRKLKQAGVDVPAGDRKASSPVVFMAFIVALVAIAVLLALAFFLMA
jgi:hypothetical protein